LTRAFQTCSPSHLIVISCSISFLSIHFLSPFPFPFSPFHFLSLLDHQNYVDVNRLAHHSIHHGSFGDFFDFFSDVVFLDCSTFAQDSMLDEGVLLATLFFPLCRQLLSGTYLICVTMGTSLSNPDLVAMGFPGFTCVFNKPLLPLGRNRTIDRTRYDKQVWVLRSSRSSAV
jgi:hypothetical protein